MTQKRLPTSLPIAPPKKPHKYPPRLAQLPLFGNLQLKFHWTEDMPNESNYRMIRVPAELANRLDELAAAMLAAHEKGQTQRVKVTDQGERGSWVPLAEVIRVCVDDFEAHRERSRRRRRKNTTQPSAPIA